MTLAERLIREHKVAVIPGPAFGMTDGCYFRVAYGALQKERSPKASAGWSTACARFSANQSFHRRGRRGPERSILIK